MAIESASQEANLVSDHRTAHRLFIDVEMRTRVRQYLAARRTLSDLAGQLWRRMRILLDEADKERHF